MPTEDERHGPLRAALRSDLDDVAAGELERFVAVVDVNDVVAGGECGGDRHVSHKGCGILPAQIRDLKIIGICRKLESLRKLGRNISTCNHHLSGFPWR